MNERVLTVGIGIVGWLGAIFVVKIFKGINNTKSLNRCSNVVKKEIKNIKRYNKSVNDACK